MGILTFVATGTVSVGLTGGPSSFDLGTPFTFTAQVDTSTPDAVPANPFVGLYVDAVDSVAIGIDGGTLGVAPATVLVNDNGSPEALSITSSISSDLNAAGLDLNGFVPRAFELRFSNDLGGEPLVSDSLVDNFNQATLESFSDVVATAQFESVGGDDTAVTLEIASFSVVPTPPVASPIAIGLVVMTRRRRSHA